LPALYSFAKKPERLKNIFDWVCQIFQLVHYLAALTRVAIFLTPLAKFPLRLHLYLDAPSVVTFDHLPALKGAFHRWTGHNPGLHDGLSLYSFSWLRGGRGTRGGLRFEQGAHWSISAYDPDVIFKAANGAFNDRDLGLGLVVQDAQIIRPPDFEVGEQHFRVLSPVFIKDEVGKGKPADHLLPSNPRADELLTETLRHKLRKAGLDDMGATVRFDPAYIATAKTKTFQYKAVRCRASVCPVLVSGTAEQIKFAWCVGVGHSTGIGCGCLE
jgi:CRISPR-associated endoribonuclease Cas6